jgi:hypothetical protein
MPVDSTYKSARVEWAPDRRPIRAGTLWFVALAGVFIGIFAIATNAYIIAAVVAGILLIGLTARQFQAALAIYALVAFVAWGRTPDLAVGGSGVGNGLYISELMLCLVLAVWFAKYLFGTLPTDRIKSGFHVPIALYIAYCVLNVVNSFIFWDSHIDPIHQHWQVNVTELGLRILSAGAFLVMATAPVSRRWLYWVTGAILAPGLYQLMNSSLGDVIPVKAVWWPLVIFLPAFYGWAYATDSANTWPKRMAWGFIVALSVFAILIRNLEWVSGWLGLGVGLGVVSLIRSRKLAAVLLLLTVVICAVIWPIIHSEVIVSSENERDFDRLSLLAGGWRYATTFPLGIGMGNYRSYNSYYYGDKWGTTSYTSAHGTYSQHLAEMGIPGLILLLAILVSGFTWMLRSYRSIEDRFTRTYLLAAMGQLAGIASAGILGDYIIPTYHNGGVVMFSATVYSWLIWGLSVAYVRGWRKGQE